MKKTLLTIAAATAATAALACTTTAVKVWVGGDGRVTGDMGTSCDKSSNPCTVQVTHSQEWFVAEANNGSDFIAWDGCPEVHQQYCLVTYTEDQELAAMFAPSNAPKVQVQACQSGILPHARYCSPYVGKTFALVFGDDTLQIVGWDNRTYAGTYSGNMFTGRSGGELMTAVDNGTAITIALYPQGYSDCSSSAPNCVVSIVTQLQ